MCPCLRQGHISMYFSRAGTAIYQCQHCSMFPVPPLGTDRIGDLIALLSALTYAANYLIRERLRAKFSASTTLYWDLVY